MAAIALAAPFAAALLAAQPDGAAARTSAGSACPAPVVPPVVHLVRSPRWLSHVLITEYFPAPERWFDGREVAVPGLPGRHRIDWLYSARGLAMQGEGIGADGRFYHFAGPYAESWRNRSGQVTLPCPRAPGYWDNGFPAWIGPTWLNGAGTVTYPQPGGWSAGSPVREETQARSLRFAPGPSLSLSFWHDAAVDPRLIPYGSSLFVPAYCTTPARGWLIAADTGGAILGPHIDVYRTPPQRPWASQVLRDQRVFVVPPGFARPASLRCR